MARFQSSAQLQALLQALFDRIGHDPSAVQAVGKAKLIIRFNVSDPETAVLINGRKHPPELAYGTSSLRPDLDIQVSADTLHSILLRELRLRDAIARRQLVPRGPVWKSFVLEDIFHAAQELYPQVLAEFGLQ